MRWSLKIARTGATSLYIHFTFFVLIAWIAIAGWRQGGAPSAMAGVILALLIFLCVLLHEYGHVLAAARHGIRTHSITLLPIGGLARLERMPEQPGHELIIALAGPMVNIVIFVVLLIAFDARPEPEHFLAIERTPAPLAGRLAAINLLLAAFNLIPAFPLDGGRVLRALLSLRMERARATLCAARTGQVIALLLAAAGAVTNPVLLLIAVFLFLVAEGEVRRTRLPAQYRACDALITHYQSLSPDETAGNAGRLLLNTPRQGDFPVIGPDGRLVGLVTRQGLITAIRHKGANAPVRTFMDRGIATVDADEPLDSVLRKLSEGAVRAVAVTSPSRGFIGYVNARKARGLRAPLAPPWH